jgi:hypothetical protein
MVQLPETAIFANVHSCRNLSFDLLLPRPAIEPAPRILPLRITDRTLSSDFPIPYSRDDSNRLGAALAISYVERVLDSTNWGHAEWRMRESGLRVN